MHIIPALRVARAFDRPHELHRLRHFPVGAQNAATIPAFKNFAKYESMKIPPGGKYLAYTDHEAEHEVMTVLHYPELRVSTQVHFGDQTDDMSMVVARISGPRVRADTRVLREASGHKWGGREHSDPLGAGIDYDSGNRIGVITGP
jgi:hypothetical protein